MRIGRVRDTVAEALRGTWSAIAGTPRSPVPDIENAWEIIDRTLHDSAPAVAASLRSPASPSDLARLADAAGQELPADLAASLRIHDGQDDPTRLLAVFDDHRLLSVAEMIDDLEMRSDALGDELDADDYDWMEPHRVRTIPNCRGWVRFTDAEGHGWAVDLDPLPAGRSGQVIWLPVDGPTPAPEADSYAAWLTDLARRFEAGAYRTDETGRIRLES